MELYRYQLKSTKEGILVSLDDYFSAEEIFDLAWIFECKLDHPGINMSDTISFFTQEGNRKFKKAVSKIISRFNDIGIEVEEIRLKIEDVKENILYKDKLQVICLRDEQAA